MVARRSDLVYDIRDPTTAKVKYVHFNLLNRAANDMNHNLKKNSKTSEVVKLSFESEDEIILLPPFAGNLNIEDHEINLPNNQALVRPNNAPLLRHNIVQQEGNAGPAEGQAFAVYTPQRKHGRYNLRTNHNRFTKLKESLMLILAILLLVTIVFGNDVHVFPEIGAIAERCGDVAFQSSSTIFSMVLRLEIPTPRVPQWHCYNRSTHLEQFLQNNIDAALLPTLVSNYYRSYFNLPNNNYFIR